MTNPSSKAAACGRFVATVLAIFAFWFTFQLLLYTAGGVEFTRDGRHVPALSWAWFEIALGFVVPFGIGTTVVWYVVPWLIRRRPFEFWEGCVVLVLATSVLHGALHMGLFGTLSTWRQVPMFTLVVAFQYTGIVGFVLALHHRREVERRRRDTVTAQLRALRAQLQPHFLFNTLQAIGTTAQSDGPAAARMITLLGDMLRHTLRERDTPTITLAEEKEQLAPYLQLQQLRFADRLEVEIELPPALLGAEVPDLLLQPLIENALEHGIAQRPGASTVRIRAHRESADLVLQVVDDGVAPGTAATKREAPRGTGLGATTARLRALYGDRAHVQLEANHLGGTTATVRLPFSEVARAA